MSWSSNRLVYCHNIVEGIYIKSTPVRAVHARQYVHARSQFQMLMQFHFCYRLPITPPLKSTNCLIGPVSRCASIAALLLLSPIEPRFGFALSVTPSNTPLCTPQMMTATTAATKHKNKTQNTQHTMPRRLLFRCCLASQESLSCVSLKMYVESGLIILTCA